MQSSAKMPPMRWLRRRSRFPCLAPPAPALGRLTAGSDRDLARLGSVLTGLIVSVLGASLSVLASHLSSRRRPVLTLLQLPHKPPLFLIGFLVSSYFQYQIYTATASKQAVYSR